MKKQFSNKHVTADGNTWTISGHVETVPEASEFKCVITQAHGDVNDKESFEHAVQNFMIEQGYVSC